MKNLQELKEQVKDYFGYMYTNQSEEEIAKYDYDSFLDFSSFLDEIKIRGFKDDIDINDYSDDEISLVYDQAIEELLNRN